MKKAKQPKGKAAAVSFFDPGWKNLSIFRECLAGEALVQAVILRQKSEKWTRTVPQDVTEIADPTVIVIEKDAKVPAVPVVLLEVVLLRQVVRPGAQVQVLVHPDPALVTKKARFLFTYMYTHISM